MCQSMIGKSEQNKVNALGVKHKKSKFPSFGAPPFQNSARRTNMNIFSLNFFFLINATDFAEKEGLLVVSGAF